MKTGLIIRHVPHEGIAGYRQPIEAAGYELQRIDVADPAFASLDLREPDLLIMMGGPLGVYEQAQYPWISCQLRRLKLRLEAGLPTLGVCFGAQMIAEALGGHVYEGPRKEVGFHPVRLNDVGKASPLRHIEDVPVLHWHGDTFVLPDNVELLGSSHIYDYQAFRRGNSLLSLQFHAEMGEDPRFHEWMNQWPEAVTEAGETDASMREIHDRLGPQAVAAGRLMIAEWLEGLNG